MCTVTFLPRRRGYALAMNRDEKLTRAAGLPPSRRLIDGRAVLSPSEPGGGTWIAVNQSGVTFALINWYSVEARANQPSVSRGTVVNAVCALDSPGSASAALDALALKRINPFRLIGFFPAAREIVEWRWDLNTRVLKRHRWLAHQWISSGFDESAARRVRGQTFRRALGQRSAGGLDWLRRLHRSHTPGIGPFSTCMHRAEAATVSCAEVLVGAGQSVLRYHSGAPCHRSAWDRCRLFA